MECIRINEPQTLFDIKQGNFQAGEVISSKKKLGDLSGVFIDEKKRQEMDQSQVIYEVDCYFPVAEGKEGGLFWGVTRIFPGKVGNEYFMTRGHFHAQLDTAEFYWGISGEGIIIFMDQERNCRAEYVKPNSLHYIPGCIAHRVVNIGNDTLVFGACWGSDAGHDYGSIEQHGFSARVIEKEGIPVLIKN